MSRIDSLPRHSNRSPSRSIATPASGSCDGTSELNDLTCAISRTFLRNVEHLFVLRRVASGAGRVGEDRPVNLLAAVRLLQLEHARDRRVRGALGTGDLH